LRLSQICRFDPGHADGIRRAELDAGARVFNEMISQCQRSPEGIEQRKAGHGAAGVGQAEGNGRGEVMGITLHQDVLAIRRIPSLREHKLEPLFAALEKTVWR